MCIRDSLHRQQESKSYIILQLLYITKLLLLSSLSSSGFIREHTEVLCVPSKILRNAIHSEYFNTRPGRRKTDQIFAVHRTSEKCFEFYVYILFVDYSQAFGRVQTEAFGRNGKF